MTFVYPIDTAETVREELLAARAAKTKMISGKISQWSSNSTTVTRTIKNVSDLDDFITECIEFLQIYDPEVRRANPFCNRTRPYMG